MSSTLLAAVGAESCWKRTAAARRSRRAAGGSVRGGRIAGEQVAVRPETLFQNRDYPVLNEYRAVLGGLFGRMYGLSAARLERVFPGAAGRDAGLV